MRPTHFVGPSQAKATSAIDRGRDAHFTQPRPKAGIERHVAHAVRSLRELLQQRLGLLQVERIEALGEPAIDRGEKIVGLLPLALIAPEAGEAGGGA